MNRYITEFLRSEYFNNPDYIEGVQAGLSLAKSISEDLELGLGERKEFQELSDFADKHRRDLPM